MAKKSIDRLVGDIYKYLKGYPEVSPEAASELALNLSRVITEKLSRYRSPSLSMSCIGHPQRKLNLELHKPIKVSGKDRLRFLYGDIIETLVLWLAKQAGHDVKWEQKEVSLDGVSGHIDAVIDDVLADLKSCSPFSYKKFSQGTLPTNDPFGYLAQLSGYKTCLKKKRAGFLAVDKVSGDMCFYEPDPDMDLPDPKEVISRARKAVKAKALDLPPCEEPVKADKSGNLKLGLGCKLCHYRDKCWPDARVFQFSTGPEYYVKVLKQPRVKELTKDSIRTLKSSKGP